jgi:Ser/Thr protein kinase RdoA (MazF antagonist)
LHDDALFSAVLDVARQAGIDAQELRPLRSTNNRVYWLAPTAVAAKVHRFERSAHRELVAGLALAARAAPVVPPADGLGEHVHHLHGFDVTFWRNVPPGEPPSSTAVAAALADLHRCLAEAFLACRHTCLDQIDGAILALDTLAFATVLDDADRRLLSDVLVHARDDLRSARWSVIHGSPHRMNILSADGAPVFIDLETIELGPVEWDLAHLEPEVAQHFPHPYDHQLLARARLAVSAATAAWCWSALDDGPDMLEHAEHHLGVVRSHAS